MVLDTRRQQLHDYKPYGGARELFEFIAVNPSPEPDEILFEGPAGTGKSRAWGELVNFLCESVPGIRIAVVRKTRVSLSESWMVTFETKVLLPDHPAVMKPVSRSSRAAYTYPNGSVVVMGGMDNPTRLFSTEYDVIFVNEANELAVGEWESLHRALRNNAAQIIETVNGQQRALHRSGTPIPAGWTAAKNADGKPLYLGLLVGDCNPDAPTHWLNQRCNDGRTHRIRSRHSDNPSISQQYLKKLSMLTGVRRKRLFEGVWAAAEGQIWSKYDPVHHMVKREQVPDIHLLIAGIDWGYTNPGVIEVAGVTKDDNVYQVHEVYRPGMSIKWWVDKAKELRDSYGIYKFICDPAEPDKIDEFRRAGLPAQAADNAVALGIETVEEMLGDPAGTEGTPIKPRMYLCEDALEYRDPRLSEAKAAIGLHEEIGEYVWEQSDRQNRERVDPHSPNHACDAWRYLSVFLRHRRSNRIKPAAKKPKPGTYGSVLGLSSTKVSVV